MTAIKGQNNPVSSTNERDEVFFQLGVRKENLLNDRVEQILGHAEMSFFKSIYEFLEGRVLFVATEDAHSVVEKASSYGGPAIYLGVVSNNSEVGKLKFDIAEHLLRFATFEYLTLGDVDERSYHDFSAIQRFSHLIAVYLMAKINPDFLDEKLKSTVLFSALKNNNEYPEYLSDLKNTIDGQPGLTNLRKHFNFSSLVRVGFWQSQDILKILSAWGQQKVPTDLCFKIFDAIFTTADKLATVGNFNGLLISNPGKLIDHFSEPYEYESL